MIKNQKVVVGTALLVSLAISFVSAYALAFSESFKGSELIPTITLLTSYLSLSILFIQLTKGNKKLDKNQKLRWTALVLFLPFIGCVLLFQKYSSEINSISSEMRNKMNKRKESLSEFHPRSNR